MRHISTVAAAVAIMILTSCASTGGSESPSSDTASVSREIPPNARVYDVDYDTAFQAALDALSRIEAGGEKLAWRDTGSISSIRPKGAGTIQVTLEKISPSQTLVEITEEKPRKLFQADNDSLQKLFFEEFLLLTDDMHVGEPSGHAGDSKPSEPKAGDDEPSERNILLARLRDNLKLDAQKSSLDDSSGDFPKEFLDGISIADLALLDAKVMRLAALSADRDKLAAGCAACYIDLARIYHDDERYDRSVEALRTALSIDPNNALARCNLGEAFRHLGFYDQALEQLDQARLLDPELPDTFINLGIIYDEHLGRDSEALGHYRRYIELGGADERVQEWIGEIENSP
jgi:tetratricopeptide (TPR) repeat protein